MRAGTSLRSYDRGTSLIRKHLPLRPHSRSLPKVLWWSSGGAAVSNERDTPVGLVQSTKDHPRDDAWPDPRVMRQSVRYLSLKWRVGSYAPT